MPEVRHCAECGAELPPDSTAAKCIQCLLRFAESDTRQNTSVPSVAPAGQPPQDRLSTISITPARTDAAGDRIGRYKILQELGEGGCGTVYMAEREDPVLRVALKVIKL